MSADAKLLADEIERDIAYQERMRDEPGLSFDGEKLRLIVKALRGELYVGDRTKAGFQWPSGTRPVYVESLNGDVAINDDIEDAPLIVVSGLNGVSAKAWLEHLFELAAKGQQSISPCGDSDA